MISLMPTDLYGPADNYDLKTSHVFPVLIRRIHEAKMGDHDQVGIMGGPPAFSAPIINGVPARKAYPATSFLSSAGSVGSPFAVTISGDARFDRGLLHRRVRPASPQS